MKKLVLILSVILFGLYGFAAETDSETQPFDADIAIRFYDRRVY